ncbi:MAG: 1,4-dihydroxy-2-naphthoate octaprenyltransferase [Proteobacteria bacterium]|nr:1,4-dihydroxy-2-naphthoate octaprenyltransferase [Pseudomonadota bacterium]
MKSKIGTWFLATRPWSFTMSIIAVTIGAAWAVDQGFSLALFLATVFGMVCLHGATNLLNDYFDVKNQVDTPEAPTANYRPHPLMNQDLKLNQVLAVALVLYALGAATGLWLTAIAGWPILAIGIAGVAVSAAYTAPPLALKYRAMGEPAVFLMWGPLAISGAYYVQAGHFSEGLILVSIPFGALVALVLLANNLRDADFDQRQGILTLAVAAGGRKGRGIFAGLMAGAFLAVFAMSFLGPLSAWSLLVLLALPLAVPMFRMVSGKIPDDADARTAKLDTVFGVLLIASILLERLV